MGIGSIGGATSFWQDDQAYFSSQQSASSSQAATNSVINAIASAETNLGKGLASIANATALGRVNSQLSSAIQSVLSGNTTSTPSSTASSAAASTSTAKAAVPATGTGKASVSISTPLSILNIPAGSTLTFSSGGKTTSYATTGSDTVGDLLLAINTNLPDNAPINAALNNRGDIVLTAKNTTNLITVGGTFAPNIGFSGSNQTFKPTAGTTSSSPAANTPAPTTTAKTSTASSTTAKSYPTLAMETSASAVSVLADSGVSGSLVDMLA
jgi:hypothetical protein